MTSARRRNHASPSGPFALAPLASVAVGLAAMLASSAAGADDHARAAAAPAPDDPTAACIAASDRGLDLRRQGHLIEARTVLADCAAAACGTVISAVCQKRIAEISSALPTIIFLPRGADGHDVVGVSISIDGSRERRPLDGRPIAIDPGVHAVRFEAPGQPPVERSFLIAEGAKDRQEHVDVGPAAPVAPATPPPSPAPTTSVKHEGGSKTGAWILGGVGVLGVAAGSVFGLLAMSESSSSQADCRTSTNCANHSQAVSEHNSASTDGTVSTIGFAAGGVALAVAAILFAVSPSSSDATGTSSPTPSDGARSAIHVEPSLAPQAAGLTLRGVFE
jgi:hypothetical protein